MNKEEARIYHENQKASHYYLLKLKSSEEEALNQALEARSKENLSRKIFIATVGFTRSGKTTVAKTLQEKIPHLVKVETDAIHDIINTAFPELQDGNTVSGEGYWLRQVITTELRESLITKLCEDGWWIINDSSNLVKSEREKRMQIPKQFGYKTVLVWMNIPEEIVLERIKQTDQKAVSEGNSPAYMDLYQNVQKPRFQEPTKDEADIILIFDNPTNIPNLILNKLNEETKLIF